MGRLKRYDLYEGEGEIIRDLDLEHDAGSGRQLPGKQPLGRDRDLRERDEWNRQEEEQRQRRRYFTRNEEDDGLGAPATLFDDLERFSKPEPVRRHPPKRRRRDPHRGAWAAAAVLAGLILTALVLLMLPQVTGIRYKFLPNLALVNGNLIALDQQEADTFAARREEIFTDRIYQGVYIDNVHVGGMTKEQAIAAVDAVHESVDRSFDIEIAVGNEAWHVTTERVPVSRNTRELVEKAWALGRTHSADLKASGITPFQDRVGRASGMRSEPVSYTSRVDWDHEALRTMVDGIVNYVNRDPVNSTVESFDFSTKAFTFTEDRPGARLDGNSLYNQVADLLDAGETRKTVRAVPEKVLAEMTKTEMMNRFGLISAYTTETTKNENRNTNIQLSAQAINGITVMPGETFSFNQTTGERTAAKGYKEAAAISGGQSRDEIGGGVCQTSSTLFNAVARANLEIVERNPHAWPSSYVEKGFDATVNWPGLDFKFKNNTDYPIFILAGYSKRKITVNLYGMNLGMDVHIDLESITTQEIPQPSGVNYVVNTSLTPGEQKKTVTGRKGYVVETWKVWYQGKRETKRELLFKTTYKAYQETVEYNPK
jgi:vancomycin resistance protein YoaR